MRAAEPDLRTAAEAALAYLAATDPLPPEPCDAILGFGVFDRRLPRFCGELHARGAAPRVIFIGGFGAGTGDLGGPEADVWREELRRSHPEIGDEQVIIENRSSNTAENVAFTAELLARRYPSLAFGCGVRRVIVVASPSRMRRTRLTLWKQQPELAVVRQLPAVSFDAERALYERNGVPYLAHLAGELDRLVAYPQRGWIADEPLPEEIIRAHGLLRAAVA